MKADFFPYLFKFKSPGGTSRGVLLEKPSWFIRIWDESEPDIKGIGECSLIPGLSPEPINQMDRKLQEVTENIDRFTSNTIEYLSDWPAICFGIETALLDLKNKGKHLIFPSYFTNGKKGISINGLIWMGKPEEMLNRVKQKLGEGFSCIKIKVGAIDFEEEIRLIQFIRNQFSAGDIEIRVDANGGFKIEEALHKIERLAELSVHSIEQPIKAGNWENMAEICKHAAIPVVLDEELIGVKSESEKRNLLDAIKPQFLILKPSLIGGLAETQAWSNLVKIHNIGWWVTSALEGNVGLNAIAQWTFLNGSAMPQGLGTGQIFSNNIESPLEIREAKLWYNSEKQWSEVDEWKNSTPQPPQGGDRKEQHSNDCNKRELIQDVKSKNSVNGSILWEKNIDENFNEYKDIHGKSSVPIENINKNDFFDYQNTLGSALIPLEGDRGWNRIERIEQKNSCIISKFKNPQNLPPASIENNFHYNPKLKERAKYLRNHATKAEACLWKYLLKSRSLGFQFTRQRPVLNYIADFMCKELMLVIEVDGITHLDPGVIKKDKKKQFDLEAVGFTVLRFEDEGVLTNIDGVQSVIEQYFEKFLSERVSTPLPPQGEKSNPQPPQRGDSTYVPPPEGDLETASTINFPNTPETLNSSNKSVGMGSVPLEGAGGWKTSNQQIILNHSTYNLNKTNWNDLKTFYEGKSWWIGIISFLEKWSDNSHTITLKTSGSTGEPKLIEIEKAKMMVSAKKTCDFFQLNQHSTGLLCLSADYIAGQMMLVRAIVSGMGLICVEPSGNPVQNLHQPIDFAAMVPYQVQQSIQTSDKFALIKNLIIGGGQVSKSLVQQLSDSQVKVYETFGMTETLSHIALREIAPVAQPEFKILQGITISSTTENCLVIDYPELEPGQLVTNDVVEIISDTAFRWIGRKDFVINSGGIKINPEEIENKIHHLIPGRYCIIGLPDQKLGEKVVLIIEGKMVDDRQFLSNLRKMLPPYFVPKEIRQVAVFPLTESGKIKRKELKSKLLDS